ncbi:MAG: hypothetical protein L0Y74_06520, partial [candidate division Zixibacteria bacterium]|nr:hypothetical protein [candidate division Zixibacteria bacterium]
DEKQSGSPAVEEPERPMKAGTVASLIGGILMLASAFAHAFLGWPAFEKELSGAGVMRDVIGGLNVGWHFGSFAMFGFGAIVVFTAAKTLRGEYVTIVPAGIIAGLYIVFGLWALLFRGFSPHFLGFILKGLLASGILLRPRASRP